MRKLIESSIFFATVAIFLVAGHFAMICGVRGIAFYRASLSDNFFMPTERAAEAIKLLHDSRAFSLYLLTTVAILTAIPLLLRIVKSKPWIGFLAALLLYIPGYLYGSEILHLSAKFIDYNELLRDAEMKTETDESPAIEESENPASNH